MSLARSQKKLSTGAEVSTKRQGNRKILLLTSALVSIC